MENDPNGGGVQPGLKEAGERLLERAHAIVAAKGENPQSMREIGELLREMASSNALDPIIAARPGDTTASMDLLAEHADGSALSFYAMDRWVSPPATHVHWHNYWQSMLIVRGDWADTVWRPVPASADGGARKIEVDRNEVIPEGDIQILGPDEPHGWTADDRRPADGVVLLMWSASAKGRPRMDLDIETGEVVGRYGFLNPQPGSPAESARPGDDEGILVRRRL
jgi:hypothetical protein